MRINNFRRSATLVGLAALTAAACAGCAVTNNPPNKGVDVGTVEMPDGAKIKIYAPDGKKFGLTLEYHDPEQPYNR